MLLSYNFVDINILGSSKKWVEYIADSLKDQVDFNSAFAKKNPKVSKLCIEVCDIRFEKNIYFRDGCVVDGKRNVAIEYNSSTLRYYCGYSRSISLSYLINLIMLLSHRGLLIHCAALVDKNNHGHVFSALGGVGKTQLAVQKVLSGQYRLLGDDLVICDADGKLYPYVRPLCLYKYHYKLLPLKLAKHYFIVPDILYKILRRLAHLSLEYFGSRQWFIKFKSRFSGINMSNDILPSYVFDSQSVAGSGCKFRYFNAVYDSREEKLAPAQDFNEFVFLTTMPEWIYFDDITEKLCEFNGYSYMSLMKSNIDRCMTHVDNENKKYITKDELKAYYD